MSNDEEKAQNILIAKAYSLATTRKVFQLTILFVIVATFSITLYSMGLKTGEWMYVGIATTIFYCIVVVIAGILCINDTYYDVSKILYPDKSVD